MITSKGLSNPARYYEELHRDSYYVEHGQAAIHARGVLTTRLGLDGREITHELFESAFDAHDAERTVKFVHSTKNRARGIDQIRAGSKEISALCALAPRDLRPGLHRCFVGASQDATDFFFRDIAVTRRGAGGTREEPVRGGLTFSALHIAGRKGQPHLHIHELFNNLVLRLDGTTGTMVMRKLFESQKLLDAVFTQSLAARLTREFGLKFKAGKHGPTLVVDQAIEADFRKLLDSWSPGSRAIDEHLRAKGIASTPRAREIAQMALRGTKEVVPYEELYTRWQQEALQFGITFEKLVPGLRHAREVPREPQPLSPSERDGLPVLFREIATDLTEKRNSFSENSFIRHAVDLAHDIGAQVAEVVSEARAFLRTEESVIPLGESTKRQLFFTTRERFEQERRLIEVASAGSEKTAAPCPPARATDALRAGSRAAALSDDAQKAFLHLATDTSRFRVLDAGRGPETDAAIRAFAQLAKREHLQVVAVTPTNTEAVAFETRTGISTHSTGAVLSRYGKTSWKPPRRRLRELRRALFGPRLTPSFAVARTLERGVEWAAEAVFGKPGQVNLSQRTLLVITSAEHIPVHDLTQLLELSSLSGGQALIVGDSSGLPTIAHRGGFANLAEKLPSARLQKPIVEHPLKRVAGEGRLHIGRDHDDALRQLVRDWAREGGTKRPASDLILTPSDAERHRANILAQRARWRALRIAPLHFLRAGGYRIHQSDRVVFRHGLRVRDFVFRRRVRTGEFGTVTAVNIVKHSITVKTERGVKVTFDPRRHPDLIALGYALTLSSGAGVRPHRVRALVNGSGLEHALRRIAPSCPDGLHVYSTTLAVGEHLERFARPPAHQAAERTAQQAVRENAPQYTHAPQPAPQPVHKPLL